MRPLASVVLAAALFGGAGCTTKTIPGPLVVSTRPVPELGTAEPAHAKRVVGESCGRALLFIIPIGIATAQSAYEEALSQAPGADTLIGYEERSNMLFLFPFYYQVCTEIHGYAVSSKAGAQPP